MSATLYIATSNPGKLRDFAFAAAAAHGPEQAWSWRIEILPGLEGVAPPPEDADSFAGNAAAKAIGYSWHAPGLLVLADDSGLEVDALGGAPGVYSARYAERAGLAPLAGESVDERNNRHLLAQLSGARDRRARYRCSLAVARDGEVLATADGTLEGTLLEQPRGARGFGYDPLFLVEELGLTMAEVDEADRLRISHRGRALAALLRGLVPF